MSHPLRALPFALLSAVLGCASTVSPTGADAAPEVSPSMDARPDADVALPEASLPDAARDVPLDVSAALPCDLIVDLNARATRRPDGARTYIAEGPATAERTAWTPPYCFRGFRYRLAYLTAFRYTAERAGEVSFAVIDANPSQPLALAALLLDACASDLVAMECSVAPSPTWAGHRRDLTTPRRLRVGESVVLLVGSAFPQPPEVAPYGRFEVRVTELPTRAEGERCGPRTAGCADGALCSYSDSGVCRAAGGFGQRCRRDQSCDAGLGCSGGSVCVRVLRPGDACNGVGTMGACPVGTHCASNGTSNVCTAYGARGAYCREAEPRCDAGLSCDLVYCRPTAAEGEVCGGDQSCAAGTHCVTTAPMMARCMRDGARGGRCVVPEFTCDPGLGCSERGETYPVCLPGVAIGGACDPLHQTSGCLGGTCANGVCRPDGARDAACRATSTPCDEGLGCYGPPYRCRALAAVGALCSGRACPAGSTCASPDGFSANRCLADGAASGRCRVGAPICDAGLACSNAGDTEREGRCRPAIARGGACDPTGMRNACADGLACDAVGRCAPLGSVGTPCREGSPFCDEGAQCLGQGTIYRGTCRVTVPSGGVCTPSRTPCALGTTCIYREPSASPTCAPAGTARGARCRDVSPECDSGLTCGLFDRTCVPEIALGERCDVLEWTSRCVGGAGCLASAPEPSGVCVRDGLAGHRCRTTAPACDTGLSCSGPALAAASRCL